LEEAASHDKGIKTHRNWTLLSSQHWTATVELLGVENSNIRVEAECNLGLVEFKEGLPVSHTLLTGNGKLIYHLP
jgi:hypothetical protein